ncbi:site-specific integrase [Pseudomonas sp. MIL9]|uniref:site-specific integrase n=1 Tax=Pseudomonas sp. MIL9 TaxID=2807620 RepID=UPI0019521974|nr:site-specific integrase [Pseudomonas sp. MIL9]MBM6444442.1 site-specific integrase [Pseudomonas sp. MIL9]
MNTNDMEKFAPLLALASIQKQLQGIQAFGEVQAQRNALDAKAAEFISYLGNLQVSKLSVFIEDLWDFNADFLNVAFSAKGKPQQFDFTRFPNLPLCAAWELKAVLALRQMAPGLAQAGKVTGAHTERPMKPRTILGIFSHGFRFFDKLFELISEDLGAEHVALHLNSVSQIPSRYYEQAAREYDYAYEPVMNQFFSLIRSPEYADAIFGKALPNVNLATLPWKKVGKTLGGKSSRKISEEKVLDNKVFERASLISSLAIVDFLDAMGEPVIDRASLERRNAKGYRLSAGQALTREKFDIYIYKRLMKKGYTKEQVVAAIGYTNPKIDSLFDYQEVTTFRKLAAQGMTIDDDFRDYINFVSYAAQYVVGQYTGMRPSELAEVDVNRQPKETSKDLWVIQSQVTKHQENSVMLFDDYWVAIPIVRDAMRVGALISKYKNNPYLFCNAFTMAPGEVAKPVLNIGHMMTRFFARITPEGEDACHFYPYMLRHTLAHHLYRADLGLPFISHQLKHFGEITGGPGHGKGFSKTTLAYGEIGDMLAKGGAKKGTASKLRHQAELESIKSVYDPDANYAGVNAEVHKANLQNLFRGYMVAGYSKDEIFEVMAFQKIAIVSVGQGYCYGSGAPEAAGELPCIGGLRCNPNRCKNSVVSAANAPRWREVYHQNKMNLDKPEFAHNRAQMLEAMEEAKGVLEYLGEAVEVDVELTHDFISESEEEVED